MIIAGPISFRKRDKAVKALVRRGHATDDELFEAQFGEWPPRGLHKEEDCSDIVHFKGFYRDRKLNPLSYVFSMGYTRKEDQEDKSVYLNGLMMSPLGHVFGALTSRMAWVRARDVIEGGFIAEAPMIMTVAVPLAMISSYRFALASSLTKMIAPSIADIVGEEQIHIKQFKEDSANIARAAFQNVAYDWLNNQGPGTKAWVSLLQTVDTLLTLMPRSYFSSDYELQARLHNIMTHGYKAWGKLPENKDEFYLALRDMGIIEPSIVRPYYNNPEFDGLKQIFQRHTSWQEAYTRAPNAEMNIGLNSFRSKDVLEMYWRDCLPYLYADLLVKYGDPNGLERMGYVQEKDLLGMPLPKGPETP